MGYLKLSEHEAKYQKIMLDNTFVVEYLPAAPDSYVKVYLAGLSLALTDPDNGADTVAHMLMLDESVVSDAFAYWQEQGLVHVSDGDVCYIEYLPVVPRARQLRKFSKEKYRTFNDQLHVIFPHRNILPNEYNEYYTLMEHYNIEVEAMLTVIGYCKRLKGEDVSYPYIVTVARNLAKEGLTTFDRVNERLTEMDLRTPELKTVLKALGTRRLATPEDKQLYTRWTKEYGFTQDAIVYVAKMVKFGEITGLSTKLTKYHENQIMSVREISEYESNREHLMEITKNVAKILGVSRERFDYFSEIYTSKWISMGFDALTLTSFAEHCVRKWNFHTFESFDTKLQELYTQGKVTTESIGQFIQDAVKSDAEIRAILKATGLERDIISRDRDFYRTWTFSWKMPADLVLYAAELSKNAGNPISYMNVVLSSWHDKGIETLEAAKNASLPGAGTGSAEKPKGTNHNIISHNYTADELNAIFDSLDKDPV